MSARYAPERSRAVRDGLDITGPLGSQNSYSQVSGYVMPLAGVAGKSTGRARHHKGNHKGKENQMGLFGSSHAALTELRESGFEGPADANGEALMSRTSPDGRALPLFEGGTGHGTPDDRGGRR